MGPRRKDDRFSRSVGLIISIAVRYPEIATVKYEPREQTIRLGLLITGDLPDDEWSRTEAAFLDTLEVYLLLEQRQAAGAEISRETFGELTAVSITRDAATLSPEEIYTIVEFFKERYGGRMVSEAVEYGTEDEWMAQDEMIEDMVEDLERSRNPRNLIAMREDGRVVVFQK